MARRRKITSDGSGVSKKAKSEPKAPKGKPRTPVRNIPWGAIAFAVIIALVVALFVAMRPVDDSDDDDEPIVPTELVRSYEASISTDSVFLLTDRNDTIQIVVNNTGELDDDYNITVDHSDQLDIHVSDSLSLDPGENETLNLTVESIGTFGLYEVYINVTVVIPVDEANTTAENTVIVNRTTQVQLEFSVYVSQFNLDIRVLDDAETAAPGESVIFVIEIENNGTLDTNVDLTISKLNVDNGGKEKWTGAAQLDAHQLAMFENDITHVRMNVTVPQNANPDGEVAHFTITAESVDAIAAGVPLAVSTQVHLTISNIGFYATPDSYEKEVQEEHWVEFDCEIRNSGGTDVYVKYRVSEIPADWMRDLDPYPEDGWFLGDTPVTFSIAMRPENVDIGDFHRFIVEIYSDDHNETSFFSVNVTIAEPRFDLVAQSQYVPIDLEPFERGIAYEHEIIISNLGLLEYQVNLTLEHPPTWDMDIDPGWIWLEQYSGTEWETATLRFLMPTNTSAGEHPFLVVGEAWGIEVELNLIAVVEEYLNGTLHLPAVVPELNLSQPPINGSSQESLEFVITNTGNSAATFEIVIENYQDLDLPGWKINLTSGQHEGDERIVITINPGKNKSVFLNAKVNDEHEEEVLHPSLSFLVHRDPIWQIDRMDAIVQIQ